MSYNKQDLIDYRLEKARQSLAEANAMADLKYWDTVSNRLYYACFYAITAYWAQTGIRAITHKGIKSAFHKELIKSGLMSKDLGKLYGDLFNKRQEADYKDFANFEASNIQPLIQEAVIFVDKIEQIISP